MSSDQSIIIRDAHEHNLKHINITLPRNRLIVVTGLSGSGKSSLVFDTLYAEGQRRYVESLSAYARQFLDRLEKPDVESIEGLSPAIAIEQRSTHRNPRSTVATQTEIYDYLRVLYARAGQPHCPKCNIPISQQSVQEIVLHIFNIVAKDSLKRKGIHTELSVLAPVIRGRKGEYIEVFHEMKRQGFVRVRVDDKLYDLDESFKLDKKRAHNIDVVVDRIDVDPILSKQLASSSRKINELTVETQELRTRLTESIETALKVGKGLVTISLKIPKKIKNSKSLSPTKSANRNNDASEYLFSELYACASCGFSYEELSPRTFSFNSPYGACAKCDGLGTRLEIDSELVVPDKNKSLREGAIEPWKRGGMHMTMYYSRLLREVTHTYGISLDVPFRSLSRTVQRVLLEGSDDEVWGDRFEGVIPNLERRFRQTESDYVKHEISRYMSELPCPSCRGARLKPQSLSVMIDGKSISQLTTFSIGTAMDWLSSLRWNSQKRLIAEPLIKEIIKRLQFLIDVGLGYLTLERASGTLSGGEAQRIRLATQVGSGLVGVMYILDEPSIGLHQRDNEKLLNTLERLRELGNTLIIIEHDEATIRRADYIVDLGPGAGRAGGEIVACGSLDEILKCERSLTGQFLSRKRSIPIPSVRRRTNTKKALTIKKASEHNLKSIDVRIPLGCFVSVTGVSGSGKSTLVDDILYRTLAKKLSGYRERPGKHERILGMEHVDKVIVIDQSPIGRTPRSNPATYTGTFGPIRELFSKTPAAKLRGFEPGRFSFNVKGGRCEACQGDGIKRIEMHFLPDVFVRCEVCKGKRFNEQTLQVTYKDCSIADVLSMTVDDARKVLGAIPAIDSKLSTIQAVGLGYLELGQSATTLSGGEAQRIKLAKELSRRDTGRTVYLLDEPTTGLHFADVEQLLGVLHRLVDHGNTVVVIEHNLDVIKTSDYIIDLGPEGGDKGGYLVVAGSPEEVAARSQSWTGQFLKPLLNGPKSALSLVE